MTRYHREVDRGIVILGRCRVELTLIPHYGPRQVGRPQVHLDRVMRSGRQSMELRLGGEVAIRVRRHPGHPYLLTNVLARPIHHPHIAGRARKAVTHLRQGKSCRHGLVLILKRHSRRIIFPRLGDPGPNNGRSRGDLADFDTVAERGGVNRAREGRDKEKRSNKEAFHRRIGVTNGSKLGFERSRQTKGRN